jgi:hypothetical protein
VKRAVKTELECSVITSQSPSAIFYNSSTYSLWFLIILPLSIRLSIKERSTKREKKGAKKEAANRNVQTALLRIALAIWIKFLE